MSDEDHSAQIRVVELKIETLTARLSEAKAIIERWIEAGRSLSLSAADARAKNQGAGRGFMGAFLGAKFRGVMRAGAAASNASIAQDVAKKRSQIAEGKREAQEVARQIQAELSDAKAELKALSSRAKVKAASKTSATQNAVESLTILQKLKEAKDLGLLTEAEFEEKRKKLVSRL
jgi:hypothetical protein